MRLTLEEWGRRVWAERDETAIDNMMVAGTQAHGLGGRTLVGPDDFKSFHRALCALLSDTELLVDHAVEADGWLAALCTFRGTTKTGRRLSVNGAIHARIADGRIHEAYNHFDFIGLFALMGLLPEDTLVRCLAGERIGT